jgi:hypothetical protein
VVAIVEDEEDITTDGAVEMFLRNVESFVEDVVVDVDEVKSHAGLGIASGVKESTGRPSESLSMDESMMRKYLFSVRSFYSIFVRSIRLS